MNNKIVTIIIIALCLGKGNAEAQNIQYSMFDAMPLVLNPSYTGMIEGNFRGNVIYRNGWKSISLPYTSFGLSFDAPVMILKNGDYFGAGFLAMHDNVDDGRIVNNLDVMSVSYHKLLGSDSAFLQGRGSDLAFGLQAGYAQGMIDLPVAFFNAPQYGDPYSMSLGNQANYYVLNAGASFSRAVSGKFSYIIGFKVNNINQPSDALLKQQNAYYGFDRRYVVSAGCNIVAASRFSLRPALIFVNQSNRSDYIVGNEFRYEVNATQRPASVFIGTWYRSGDVAMVAAGINTGIIRIGVNYDYDFSALNSTSNGGGGFEVAIGFNSPSKTNRQRYVPCTRF